MDLVDGDAEEGGEERGVLSRRDGAALVVAEAEVVESARGRGRRDGAVEEVDETLRILAVCSSSSTARRSRSRAACVRERDELRLDDRQQCLRRLPAIGIEPPGQRVRPGHGDLQRRSWRRDLPQPLELLDRAEAARGRGLDDPVLRALAWAGGRAGAGLALLDALEEAVEAEVEVEPSLLAVRDRAEPGGHLVVHRRNDRVLLQLGDVVRPEVGQVRGGVLEPARGRDSRRSRSSAARSLPYPRTMLETNRVGIESSSTATSRRRSTTSLLRPELDLDTVREGVELALRYDVASATVRPQTSRWRQSWSPAPVLVSTVVGFPHGSHTTRTKAAETEELIAAGADEVDMVLNIGRLLSGEDEYVQRDIRAVVDAAQGRLVKVIFENAYLTDAQKIRVRADRGRGRPLRQDLDRVRPRARRSTT